MSVPFDRKDGVVITAKCGKCGRRFDIPSDANITARRTTCLIIGVVSGAGAIIMWCWWQTSRTREKVLPLVVIICLLTLKESIWPEFDATRKDECPFCDTKHAE